MRPELIVALGLREPRGNLLAMEEIAHDPVRHGPVVAVYAMMMWAQPGVAGELESTRCTKAHASWEKRRPCQPRKDEFTSGPLVSSYRKVPSGLPASVMGEI